MTINHHSHWVELIQQVENEMKIVASQMLSIKSNWDEPSSWAGHKSGQRRGLDAETFINFIK